MTAAQRYMILGGGVLLLLLLANQAGGASFVMGATETDILQAASDLIKSFERYSASPYWDKKRYSWGYGTPAPGSSGFISEADAAVALLNHAQPDYETLSGMIIRPLSIDQWAALLSFSYNEGVGAAQRLVADINAADDGVLEAHWKQYVIAGGVVDPDLVARRDREWQIWNS